MNLYRRLDALRWALAERVARALGTTTDGIR